MKIRQFQVDAFAGKVFAGNPAAVCPLDTWLNDATLQAIAEENNLSETAFFVATDTGYDLRWFTPVAEVDLCGHATLASAHVLFEHLGFDKPAIAFSTRSGTLTVEKTGDGLRMDFPACPPRRVDTPDALIKGLGIQPAEVWAADDYMAVLESEEAVRSIRPDHALLSQLDLRGVMVTAPGEKHDFVSRFFAPKYGIPEDPVTGSAHCTLAPYWAQRLGKTVLQAKQVSKRGGDIGCEVTGTGERVLLSGHAVTFLEGHISLQEHPA